ncbi:MAG TPA: COX15/CtaA family protein [Longimicrobiales bacterium]
MPGQTLDRTSAAPAAARLEADEVVRRRFARLTAIAAVFTYLLIVFGGVVRITGSGLGCGDDWPLCNGRLIPLFDVPTLIEYVHRLLAATLIIPYGAVTVYALRHRKAEGLGGAGGPIRPIVVAAGLLVVQALLGALTVKLELPGGVTALHFVTAILILGALLVATVRARTAPGEGGASLSRFAGPARAAAILGLLVVAFGALTANTGLPAGSGQPSAAAFACQGFPLCNGQIIPKGGSWVHIHWTHRLLAFLLFFHVLGATIVAWRRSAPAIVKRAAGVAFGLVLAQIIVAAALVLHHLPDSLQALHLAVGAALWGALVVWDAVCRGGLGGLDQSERR